MTDIPNLARISDYVFHHATRTPEREAAVLEDDRRTYRQLADDVLAYSALLFDHGVRRGDRVAMLSTPRPEYLVTFLATAHLGAIWMGLNPKYTRRELEYVLNDAEPRVVLAFPELSGRDYRDDLEGWAAARPDVVAFSLAEGFGRFGAVSEALAAISTEPDDITAHASEVAASDAALIVYTSGTTGAPKGAMLSHRGLVHCSRTQGRRWAVNPLRLLNNLPINHIGCVGDLSCYALVSGGTQVFMESFDPKGILATIARERLTVWGQVPTMFALTLAHPGAEAADLSSLRWIVWSGAAMPQELVSRLSQLPVQLATAYGMTETTGAVTYSDLDADVGTLASTVGRPEPTYEFRIMSQHGGQAEPGEIQVRGDWIMLGYFRRPDATAEAFTADGWFRTGDIGVQHPDGNVTLVGRQKEMYKSGGYNVYPREVEMVLESHPDIAVAVVMGVPDAIYGEVGVAVVLPEAGATVDLAELDAHARGALANYKIPKRIQVVDELPMLPVGKVDRLALHERLTSIAGKPAATGDAARAGGAL